MSKKKYNGRLRPYKKIEIISKVLIGLYLVNKLDEKLPMDEATMKVIIEFCIFHAGDYLRLLKWWIDKYVLKK